MPAPYPLSQSVTVTTGQPGSSSLWNQGPAASGGFLPNRPNAVLLPATLQSIPPNQNVPIAFDGVYRDNSGGHSTTVNNSRYTCQLSGMYHVTGQVGIQGPTNATNTQLYLYLRWNGYQYWAGSATVMDNSGLGATIQTAYEIPLDAGDFVELTVYHTAPGNLTTWYGYRCCRMSVQWVGT